MFQSFLLNLSLWFLPMSSPVSRRRCPQTWAFTSLWTAAGSLAQVIPPPASWATSLKPHIQILTFSTHVQLEHYFLPSRPCLQSRNPSHFWPHPPPLISSLTTQEPKSFTFNPGGTSYLSLSLYLLLKTRSYIIKTTVTIKITRQLGLVFPAHSPKQNGLTFCRILCFYILYKGLLGNRTACCIMCRSIEFWFRDFSAQTPSILPYYLRPSI